VTKGLAGIKFSGSPNIQGDKRHKRLRTAKSKKNPTKSLIEKYG
jgi:hypothetical protein